MDMEWSKKQKKRRITMLAVKGIYKDGKIKESDEDFFNYNIDDDVKEKIAWAVTSANAVSEWKNLEE